MAITYTDSETALGAPVGAGYAPAPPVQLRGDATTAVDPDGLPCYHLVAHTLPATARRAAVPGRALHVVTGQVEAFGPGQDWQAFLDAKPEPLLLQHVAFGVQCAHEQVTIWNLVDYYIGRANVPPSSFLPPA